MTTQGGNKMALTTDHLETPAVTVDLGITRRNLLTMATRAQNCGLSLRPHTKTHKQPFWAHEQHRLGARSLTVAKLDEAEVMLKAGLSDLLIAYPLVGKDKAYRLAALMHKGLRPTVSVDSPAALETLSLAASTTQQTISVLIEVDTGFHRCGLTGSAVTELANRVPRYPYLAFHGLMSYAGHIAGQTDPATIHSFIRDEDMLLGYHVDAIRKTGQEVLTVSVGGTVLSYHMDQLHHATEVRPGIYIFNDMGIVSAGAATLEDCAVRIHATVVSVPNDHWFIIDAGSKTLSSDGPVQESYGYILNHPEWRIRRLSEEHGVVAVPSSDDLPRVGDRVTIIPNHVCSVMNLHHRVIGVENGRVVQSMIVEGRGGVR